MAIAYGLAENTLLAPDTMIVGEVIAAEEVRLYPSAPSLVDELRRRHRRYDTRLGALAQLLFAPS